MRFLLRELLSAEGDETNGHDTGALLDMGGSGPHNNPDHAFLEIYAALLFIVGLWLTGKVAVKLRLPPLVGEIICGIIVGPQYFNLVPLPKAFQLAGELGLVLLVIEAGIDVDAETLENVGVRAIGVALFGSQRKLDTHKHTHTHSHTHSHTHTHTHTHIHTHTQTHTHTHTHITHIHTHAR
jgi:hypothetical protein